MGLFILGLASLFDTSGPRLSLTRQASGSFLCKGEREKTERDHARPRGTAPQQNCQAGGTSPLVPAALADTWTCTELGDLPPSLSLSPVPVPLMV